jgi:hypothetical protein
VKVGAAFDPGIRNIRDEKHDHQAEDPFAAGIEIGFEAVIICHFFWEKEHAQKKKKNGVKGINR